MHHRLGHRLADERPVPGERLVEDHADGEEVAAMIERLAEGLLGRHVVGRADDHAALRQRGGVFGDVAADLLGNAEVEHLRVASRHDDVVGLDVAMDDPLAVRFLQRLGHLADDAHRFARLHGAAAEDGRQRLALDQLHHDEDLLALLFDGEDGGDVGVIELGDGARLAQEARLPLRIVGDVVGEDLDGHFAQQPRVLGAPDLTHPACAEWADQPICAERRLRHAFPSFADRVNAATATSSSAATWSTSSLAPVILPARAFSSIAAHNV